jgi:putative phosphoesterase
VTRRIGVISDTHGLLRPDVIDHLQGVELILHAGDIGKPEVLDRLRAIAPVQAIRGNVDVAWAHDLPDTLFVEHGGLHMYLLHDVKTLGIDPLAEHIDIVIAGHSHQPRIDTQNGVTFLNPGSCGPRRFSLPIAMAFITKQERWMPELIAL